MFILSVTVKREKPIPKLCEARGDREHLQFIKQERMKRAFPLD